MNDIKEIVTITGPTGSGKTSLVLKLAELYPLEIISVDSRQIYRYMNIGTAKPSPDELRRVPHHLIDILDPDMEFNAGKFVDQVNFLIPQISNENRIPILVGGTAMYLWALEEGLFDAGETDPDIKKELQKLQLEKGTEFLHAILRKVDPESAERIHVNDKQRILRALELYEQTGIPMSKWRKEKTVKQFPYKLRKYILNPEREFLYDMINRRVDKMIDSGLVEEVGGLLSMGYSLKNNALNSVGYKEVIAFLEGTTDYATMVEDIKKNSRRYAKRQITWFKKYSGELINYGSQEEYQKIVENIDKIISI